MTITFAKTYNMIAYLTKSVVSEGFNQIINFLNGSSIKYALTVNLNIYVSCIKQFWSSVAIKKVNDITRLQALVDKKKVVITEASIRDAFRLDDAEGVECLPNEEIFTELARIGYEKPSTKLTFYNAFFSSQWKFMIHTILQCMSAKRTLWNEFSSVVFLSSGRKFNFSKYIFDILVRNVDSLTKFYMLPYFLQLMIRKQVGDISSYSTKYTSPALTQKVFANIRRVDVNTVGVVAEGGHIANIDADEDVVLEDAKDVVVEKSADVDESADEEESEPAKIQEVVDVVTTTKIITVVTAASDTITAASTTTTATDVPILAAIIAAAPTLTVAPSRRRKGVVIRDPQEIATPSTIIHSKAKSKDKGKWILVEEPKPLKKQSQIEQDEKYARELEAELNKTIDWDEVIDHVQRKQKEDKDVKRYQALKRKPRTEAQARKNMMIYLKNVAGFKMDYFKGMSYDDIRPIFEKYFDSNVAFLQKTKEQMDEEDSRALKRMNESQEERRLKSRS
nr:hypothetical protein [Tanacetum cinerariifolium]